MGTVSEQELDLSWKLNRLIGDLHCEVAQLPNERTINRWTRSELYVALLRCKDSMLDAQKCAIRLSRIGDIDHYSGVWIDELLNYCEEYQARLEWAEEVLMRELMQ